MSYCAIAIPLTLGLMVAMLFLLELGRRIGRPRAPWLHMVTFAAMIGVSVYLVLDLEYPRAGFVRINGFDQTLADLRRSMH